MPHGAPAPIIYKRKKRYILPKKPLVVDMVFCNKCKSFGENPVFPYNDECYAIEEIKRYSVGGYRVWGNPSQKNKNNDCWDFELRIPIITIIVNWFKFF